MSTMESGHALFQRGRDGTIKQFKRPGEEESAAAQRFIDDAVLYAAGTAAVQVPSRLYPDTHTLLTGRVRGQDYGFVSLVIAKSVNPEQPDSCFNELVTVLYFPAATALRAHMAKEIRGWAEKTGASSTDLAALLTPVNKLLEDSGERAIHLREVSKGDRDRNPAMLMDSSECFTPEISSRTVASYSTEMTKAARFFPESLGIASSGPPREQPEPQEPEEEYLYGTTMAGIISRLG